MRSLSFLSELLFFLCVSDAADDISFLIHDHCLLQRTDQITAECFSVLSPELLTLGKLGFIQPDCFRFMRKFVDAVK